MKKKKSPWYSLVWIAVWTAALGWFLTSGKFSTREIAGMVIVYVVFVGFTGYLLAQQLRMKRRAAATAKANEPKLPALNAPCPCGSGKKYKRCCGAT